MKDSEAMAVPGVMSCRNWLVMSAVGAEEGVFTLLVSGISDLEPFLNLHST